MATQNLKRLGIFGGTFDPIHFGHLLLAEFCREQRQLDQVWFLPADVPPHNQDRQLATTNQRVQMLQLALGGHTSFQVCTMELERGGVSYTRDTLESIHKQLPQTELYLLLGGDSLHDLPNWRDPDRICQLAMLTIVQRPDFPAPDFTILEHLVPAERLEQFSNAVVQMPQLQLSSSEIRRRVQAEDSVRYQTPRAVEKYIETQALYK